MSVVFSVDDFRASQLYWTSTVAIVGGGGLWNMAFVPSDGGDWVAWSATQSDGQNMIVTISVGGDPIIDRFGATDGQIYSPANLPALAPNQPVAINGIGTPAESVFLNILLRRSTRNDC